MLRADTLPPARLFVAVLFGIGRTLTGDRGERVPSALEDVPSALL